MSTSTSSDWKTPVGPEYAIDEPEFMVEYGRAMASYGNIEHALSSLYACAVDSRQPQYARASFHRVISFRDRVEMVDAPVSMITTSFLGKQWGDLAREWKSLKEVLRRSSKRRNELAHMHVWHSPRTGTFGWQDITRISTLPMDKQERREKAVTTEKMRTHRSSFDLCTKRVRKFERSLAAALNDPMREPVFQRTIAEC